ncbi:MAG: DUF4249 domain-containing protein [Chlorobi bacterium]|nr:DUF4249 domain-containing protein [Chlorobiota bacterium]
MQNKVLNKFNFIILTMALLQFGTGCEKVLDIDIPDNDRKIVVNGLLNTDSLITVNISKSLNILDSKNIKFLDDAEVKLYRNNVFIEYLTNAGNGNFKSSITKPVNGEKYKIEVSEGNIQTAFSETVIPSSLIGEITIDTTTNYVSENQFYSHESLECTVSFDDPPNEDNYYWFYLTGLYENFIWDSENFNDSVVYSRTNLYFESNDPIIDSWISSGKNGFVFSDELFKGKTIKFIINLDKGMFYGVDTNILHFNVNIITKDFYLYAITHDKHLDAMNNPFTEPVQVYTNIENGYGIFASYTTKRDSIMLIDYNNYYK